MGDNGKNGDHQGVSGISQLLGDGKIAEGARQWHSEGAEFSTNFNQDIIFIH